MCTPHKDPVNACGNKRTRARACVCVYFTRHSSRQGPHARPPMPSPIQFGSSIGCALQSSSMGPRGICTHTSGNWGACAVCMRAHCPCAHMNAHWYTHACICVCMLALQEDKGGIQSNMWVCAMCMQRIRWTIASKWRS